MKELGEKFNIELNFEWSKRIKEDILASFDNHPLMTSEKNRPGLILHQKKIHAFSPVIMIPGFTSTGLEIWNGSECSKSYFRQRMWGTTRMLQQFMLNQVQYCMLLAVVTLELPYEN
jgi:hypothetical protein